MNKVYLIGNAHLDPVWLWQWQEGFTEIKATFRSALDRMKEFPDFKFTSACGAYYMWIEKSDKKMFDEIVMRVKEGRWNLVGGWFIQPDCNIPSGESFARHALITQRYFKEKFGVISHVGYNVDSFGHNGNLPQILKKSGMDSYVFMRPGLHEKELPSYHFDWESADGSRVRTYRIPERYNIDMGTLNVFEDVEKLADKTPMMAFYGVGNHGGGATIELLDVMHKTLTDNFLYSTVDEYFNNVKDISVPVVCDDLQFHAKGCYSAMSEVKKNNRRCENMLYETEAYSVLSNKLMNTEYPSAELETAWKDVLFNQFHDTMGGCAIKEAYDDARQTHGEALAIAGRNSNFALQQISWNIDTMDGKELTPYKEWPPVTSWRTKENIGTPAVIFNPLAYEVETVVSVHDMAKIITDENGNVIPIQYVRDSKTNVNDKYKTAFRAKIPAMGYCVYKMYFDSETQEYETKLSAADTYMENEFVRIEFDEKTGEVCGFKDKKNGRDLIKNVCSAVLADETDSDTWAHGKEKFKNYVAKCESGSVKLIENGPVRAAVRCEQHFENTHIIRDYYLAYNDNFVTVKTKADFREKHKMLKFAMPVNTENPKAFCEIPYGYIERPTDGTEQPSGAWIAMNGDNGGIGAATTAQYSFDAENNVLSLTILRGAIYADHFGQRDEFCEYMEQGEHEFEYTLFPFKSFADSEKKAQALNNQPTIVTETFHKGKLGTSYSGISVSKENIIVTALKKHEDSDAIALRCYESENRYTAAEIEVFGTKFEAEFEHSEIKTFIIKDGICTETNLLENELI